MDIDIDISFQALIKEFILFFSVSYVDCSECRDEVDMERNENLKGMIRKYFEQEHSDVEAETEEVIIQSILYYLCAESTATRPITDTAQCRYNNTIQ
jgi:hypothetical protein